MKRKNGFTLIELLAIIVILAIIAVITVPIILNIIENSRKGAATDSAYGYKDAINKWYVSKLQDDNNYTLNGNYTISNGKLNNIDIPLSGDKPTNGTLTYSNNKLTGGCLTIGEYKVTFDSNGNPSSAEKGECEGTQETTLYYSFEPAAEEGSTGKLTSKEPEINPLWKYYIKETTQIGVTAYTQEGTIDSQTVQQGNFETSSECELDLNSIPQETIEEYDIKCIEINKKIINEVCGVENGTTFCLKPNDYENSVKTLNTIFKGCNADPSSDAAICYGSSVASVADANGGVSVGVTGGNCGVDTDGFAFWYE